jgi:hypothetical protein
MTGAVLQTAHHPYGIYVLTNVHNGRCYVGVSSAVDATVIHFALAGPPVHMAADWPYGRPFFEQFRLSTECFWPDFITAVSAARDLVAMTRTYVPHGYNDFGEGLLGQLVSPDDGTVIPAVTPQDVL